MVTSEDFAKGMNNLFKDLDKLSPFKKLWYKITSKKSEYQKRMEQPIQQIVDAAIPYFIIYEPENYHIFSVVNEWL